MAPSWAPKAAILGPKKRQIIRAREPLFVIFAKTAPEGGYPMGPWGKIWILERFSSKVGPILQHIWIDFDLDLGSDFALMLAPMRDA